MCKTFGANEFFGVACLFCYVYFIFDPLIFTGKADFFNKLSLVFSAACRGIDY